MYIRFFHIYILYVIMYIIHTPLHLDSVDE